MPFLPNNYPFSLVAASALTALAGGGCLLAAATAYHTVRQHIRAADGLPVATLPGGHAVPPSFSSSATVRELVNHADHKLTQDSRSVELRIPRRRDRDGGLGGSSGAIGDEEILARFVRGFFGGVVLAPERAVLRMLRVRMTCFSKAPIESSIWSKGELSDKHLPPLNAIVFGSFQVLDKHIADVPSRSAATVYEDKGDHPQQESYVDFGFGDDRSRFVGVHRFSVSRPQRTTETTDDDADEAVVVLYHHCVACNPANDRARNMEDSWLFRLHMVYADLLFREGVARLLQREVDGAAL